jgi:hypothetical protein
MAEKPEPNGWELLRGLKDLRESVDKLAAGVVSQSLFATLVDRVTTLEREHAEQRKTRAHQWFAIGLSILGIAGTIIAGIVLYNLKTNAS